MDKEDLPNNVKESIQEARKLTGGEIVKLGPIGQVVLISKISMKSNKMASSKHVKQGKYDAIVLLGRGTYFAGTIDTWTRGAYWNTKRWKRHNSHRVYFTHLSW